jgi:two-component system OmpR family response regulator
MRVLVVEDEVRMASLLRRGLGEEGWTVDVATDGTEGLWAATEIDYDAVVLDVMLPEIDGFTVCQTMRERGRWCPVLLLTARDAVADRVHGLDAGADDYLVKPFSLAELAARLRALMRRGAVERPVVLDVGGLRLDPGVRRAWREGVELVLTPREFSLLELFLRRPGQMLTREQILSSNWDFAYEGDSNIVDQYVSYLRRKIDKPFGVIQIETVRGSGYRLREDPLPDPAPAEKSAPTPGKRSAG